ncbi:MAG: tetratricopeptide repeat protein [Acidobacteriia bacterium]|nr:tetratricopeptide repeat protein [Terriglobia bacterium]
MNWLRFGMLGIASWAASAQPQAAFDLNEEGVAMANRRDYAGAIALYERAIAEWRSLGPQYEAHLGASLVNLGHALASQGKRPEALKSYGEAVTLDRRALGREHIRTLAAMNDLAATRLTLGDRNGAQALFEETLPILRARAPNDMELAHALAGLALCHLWNKPPSDANALAEGALSLAVKLSGDDSLDAASMYSTVAETHRVAGRPERAEPLYRKAIAIYERLLGPDHRVVASVRNQEALILMGERKFGLAEAQLRRVLTSLDKSCPACLPERWTAEGNLGILRFLQGKYAEADRFLTAALDLQERTSVAPGP